MEHGEIVWQVALKHLNEVVPIVLGNHPHKLDAGHETRGRGGDLEPVVVAARSTIQGNSQCSPPRTTPLRAWSVGGILGASTSLSNTWTPASDPSYDCVFDRRKPNARVTPSAVPAFTSEIQICTSPPSHASKAVSLSAAVTYSIGRSARSMVNAPVPSSTASATRRSNPLHRAARPTNSRSFRLMR